MKRFAISVGIILLVATTSLTLLAMNLARYTVKYEVVDSDSVFHSATPAFRLNNQTPRPILVGLHGVIASTEYFAACPLQVTVLFETYRPPEIDELGVNVTIFAVTNEDLQLGWFAACSARSQIEHDSGGAFTDRLLARMTTQEYLDHVMVMAENRALRVYARWSGMSYQEYYDFGVRREANYIQARSYYFAPWVLDAMYYSKLSAPTIIFAD